MPLFHIHGLSINVLASLLAGAAVIATPGFDPATFLTWIGAEVRVGVRVRVSPTLTLTLF